MKTSGSETKNDFQFKCVNPDIQTPFYYAYNHLTKAKSTLAVARTKTIDGTGFSSLTIYKISYHK